MDRDGSQVPFFFGKKNRDGIFENPVAILLANFFWQPKPVMIFLAYFFWQPKPVTVLIAIFVWQPTPVKNVLVIFGAIKKCMKIGFGSPNRS